MFAEEGAVSSEDELTAAIAKGGTVKLANDITISSSLNISGTVTLDLNDHVLKMTGSGSVIQVNGTLTLTGSAENKTAKYFSKDANGLWTLTDGITENTVSGGVITGGTGDAAFSPDAVCSRAQIVAFLWRSEKSPAAGTANPFADVKADAYYAAAVRWAVETGVTQGTGDAAFSPDAVCSRAQIVTFLWRCAK